MKALMFAIFSLVLANSAQADVVVNLPAPQGGKLLCKNAKRAAFVQEFAMEMDNLRNHIKSALAKNPQAKEDLDTSNMYGIKTNKDYVGDVQSRVTTDNGVMELSMHIPTTNAERHVLIKHNIISSTTELGRVVVITGDDNCIVGL